MLTIFVSYLNKIARDAVQLMLGIDSKFIIHCIEVIYLDSVVTLYFL
jgi:hypothetical protein